MLNRITVMGRLVRDPELKYTQSNTPVASFTLAVDRDYQSGGQEKQTDFIDCVAWRQTAEFASKYFHKGLLAVVSGRLQSRKWQDKNGNNRTSWEVVADNLYFGESKRQSQADVSAADFEELPPGTGTGNPFIGSPKQLSFQDMDDDGELPF